MSEPELLRAEGLGAIKGERVLFSGLDLVLPSGGAVILRGPNGSGKSTLLRLLAGLTRPDAGDVTCRAAHHWLGHRDGLKPHEAPRQHLNHWARAWGSKADAGQIAVRMGLERPLEVPARLLSAGQRRRTAIARLLLANRPIWLLDEPFTALDVEGRTLLVDLIEAHRRAGGGIVAALHGDAPFEPSDVVTL